MPEDSKEAQTARILLYKLFYDQTDQGMTHFLLNLIRVFDIHKQPKRFSLWALKVFLLTFCLLIWNYYLMWIGITKLEWDTWLCWTNLPPCFLFYFPFRYLILNISVRHLLKISCNGVQVQLCCVQKTIYLETHVWELFQNQI